MLVWVLFRINIWHSSLTCEQNVCTVNRSQYFSKNRRIFMQIQFALNPYCIFIRKGWWRLTSQLSWGHCPWYLTTHVAAAVACCHGNHIACFFLPISGHHARWKKKDHRIRIWGYYQSCLVGPSIVHSHMYWRIIYTRAATIIVFT